MNPYRKDFPILNQDPTIYLDNAATSQKPQSVLAAEQAFYEQTNANPLRGFYDRSIRATEVLEEARRSVQHFVGAAEPEEILFTKNATEGLNLVAYSYGLSHLHESDEILISIQEHHSNILPWQMVAQRTGARLKYLECEADGRFLPEKIQAAFSERTRLVAMTHVSNIMGRVNPIDEIVRQARTCGAVVVLDAAQSVPHMPVSVRELDVDFMAFSGHKMLGPMGIGVLYGKRKLLDAMPPFLRGGEMMESVTREGAVFAPLPHKFEAGTIPTAGAVGLQAAIRYLEAVGWEELMRREETCTRIALEGLLKIPHVRVLGSEKAVEHGGIITFVVDGVHPHDVSAILNEDHIAVRAGHHCAQPLTRHLGLTATTRASFAFYNTEEEAEAFVKSVKAVRRRMGYVE